MPRQDLRSSTAVLVSIRVLIVIISVIWLYSIVVIVVIWLYSIVVIVVISFAVVAS